MGKGNKILIILLTFILITIGCAKQDEKNTNVDTPKKKNSVITMMGWYEESNMQRTIDEINDLLDGEYELEYTFVNLQQYNNVLSTQLSAGEGPDIVVDGASFPARIKANNLLEITDEEYISNFNEAGLELVKEDDKVYGIPSYGWYSGLWYNKDIFKEHNLTLPETFDELIQVASDLDQAGVTPLGFGLSDGDTAWHSLIGYLENDFYHGDETTEFDIEFAQGSVTLNKNLNKHIENWSRLIDEGFINETMLGISNEQALSDFIAGKTAMFNGGPWQYENLKNGTFEFGMISHLGSNKDEKWLVGGPAASFGINKNGKNIDGAKKVMELLASEEVQTTILESNVGSFSYYTGLESPMPMEYDAIADTLTKGNVGCAWDRWGTNMPSQTLIDEGVKQLQSMIAGVSSTEDFLKALDNKADSIRYKE